MTELAIPEVKPIAPAVRPTTTYTPTARSIADWAHEADMAFQLAERLAKTSFIPATMKGRVGDITACLLAGNELGLPPMAALKSMDVIYGVVGLRAHAMRGLVQSHGHEIELVESTDTVCRMRGRRQGAENWQESVWTIGRAQQAGFVAKNPNYKSQPATMLVARATGEIARLIASDALHGVPYTLEELRDSQPRLTAVQAGAPVTAAEILGEVEPVPQSLPAGADHTADLAADGVEEPVDGEVFDEAAAVWSDILDAADDKHGWSAEQTEAEFLKGSVGVPVDMAPVETLQAFYEHLTGGAA